MQSELNVSPTARSEPPANRPSALPVAALVAAVWGVGLGIRLLFLGGKSLWLDEAMSLLYAAAPARLLGSGFDHAHPPLYYLLLGYWRHLGDSVFILRLSSALLGSLAVPLSYALAQLLGGRRTALTLSWLVAFSPLLVWYSQELRSYSLLVALGLAAALALVQLVARPNLGWWGLYVLTMAAALYTHYASLLLIPAQIALVVVLHMQQRATRRGVLLWLVGWPVIGALYWPWLTSPGMQGFLAWLATTNNLATLAALNQYLPVPLTLATLAGGALVLTAPLVGVAIYGARRGRVDDWNRWAAHPLVRSGTLLTLLALVVFAVFPRLYTVKKLLVIVWPFGLLAAAWIFPWTRANRLPLVVVLAASLAGALVGVTLVPKDQWRDLADYLAIQGAPTDRVWIVPGYQAIPLDYYLTHPDRVRADAAAPPPLAVDTAAPGWTEDELRAKVADGERVWLVYHTADYPVADPNRRLEKWLAQHLAPVDRVNLYRIEATLYAPR